MKIRQFIRYCFEEKPLLFCIWAGFFFRMVAVLFAEGISFGFDHFVYVEEAQRIVSGTTDIRNVVAGNSDSMFQSHGHSVIYLIVNAFILYFSELIGVFDPRSKMFIMRLLYGLLSILNIYYCYRITYRLANRKAALAIGIITSILWFMPLLCVRNLPENIASILFLAAVYRLAKTRKKTYKFADDIFTGFLMGVSVSFCYNNILIIVGVAICFLIKSGVKRSLLLLFGATIPFLTLEGLLDVILLDCPFQILSGYISGIISGSNATTGFSSIYMYISILVIAIPLPWGLAGLYGYVKSWKHCFLIFFPVTFYIVLSYLMPNKEERFMLSILPLFFILCVSGWYRYQAESRFWSTHQRLRRWCVYIFFGINTPMLILSSVSYIRKPQVETMLYLSRFKNEISSIMVDDSGNTSSKSLPLFYLGKDVDIYILHRQVEEPDPSVYFSYTSSNFSSYEHNIYTEKFFQNPRLRQTPQFVVIYGDYDIPERLSKLRTVFPQITFEKSFSPSITDRIIHFFNHHNSALKLQVYRTQ